MSSTLLRLINAKKRKGLKPAGAIYALRFPGD